MRTAPFKTSSFDTDLRDVCGGLGGGLSPTKAKRRTSRLSFLNGLLPTNQVALIRVDMLSTTDVRENVEDV